MDYDYYDDSRTRFQLQPTSSFSASAPPHEKKHQASRIEVGLCISFSVLLFGLAWKTDQDLLQFLLVWISLAMLVGPFAPSSATGGMCKVGVGEPMPPVDETDSGDLAEQHAFKNPKNHRKLSRNGDPSLVQSVPKHDSPGKSDGNGKDGGIPDGADDDGGGRGHSDEEDDDDGNGDLDEYLEFWNSEDGRSKDGSKRKAGDKEEEGKKEACPPEWTPQDLDMLKKLMVKFPRGKLQRWEAIAEAFNGKHTVESIVKMSKRAGERTKGDEDSYMQFLAKRKGLAKTIDSPLTQRWEEEEDEDGVVGPSPASQDSNGVSVKEEAMETRDASAMAKAGSGGTKKEKKKEWSETEDRALLNALKAFPKDTAMRWEKVAMAVPGRTKQQCFHHYAELRDGFRNKQSLVSGED